MEDCGAMWNGFWLNLVRSGEIVETLPGERRFVNFSTLTALYHDCFHLSKKYTGNLKKVEILRRVCAARWAKEVESEQCQ